MLFVVPPCIKYRFRNPLLLREALTHKSTRLPWNYERLEILGDKVLGLVITDQLYHGGYREQTISALYQELTSNKRLAEMARHHDLGRYILLGPAELGDNGADKTNILADVVEAIMGAAFVDGGLKAAVQVLLSFCQ